MASKTITVYASPRILEVIGETNKSSRIARCVDRYGHLIEKAKLELLTVLTADDMKAAKKVLKGHDLGAVTAAEIGPAIQRRLAAAAMSSKDLDMRLLEKVKALSELHQVALFDWIETS